MHSHLCALLYEGRFRVCCPDSQDTLIINDDEASEETTFVRDLSQDDTSCGLANQLRSSWTAIDNKTLKVTGGTYAKPGQFPWMVIADIFVIAQLIELIHFSDPCANLRWQFSGRIRNRPVEDHY
jgi:hypothetical protein